MKKVGLYLAAKILNFFVKNGAFLYTLFTRKNKAEYLYEIAIADDQKGNVVCAKLFNRVLLVQPEKRDYILPGSYHLPYAFGNPDETISSVLGKNEQRGTLSYWGHKLNNILNWLDPNHSIDSIEVDP